MTKRRFADVPAQALGDAIHLADPTSFFDEAPGLRRYRDAIAHFAHFESNDDSLATHHSASANRVQAGRLGANKADMKKKRPLLCSFFKPNYRFCTK